MILAHGITEYVVLQASHALARSLTAYICRLISVSQMFYHSYLMQYKSMRRNEALKLIKEKRDIVCPNIGNHASHYQCVSTTSRIPDTVKKT